MTLHEAITSLFDEYYIEEYAECVRDEVKADPQGFEGLSSEHPRVQKFQEICRTLRDAVTQAKVG